MWLHCSMPRGAVARHRGGSPWFCPACCPTAHCGVRSCAVGNQALLLLPSVFQHSFWHITLQRWVYYQYFHSKNTPFCYLRWFLLLFPKPSLQFCWSEIIFTMIVVCSTSQFLFHFIFLLLFAVPALSLIPGSPQLYAPPKNRAGK